MIKTLLLAITVLAFILPPSAGIADVYKHKDKNGKWVFTDAPKSVKQDETHIEKSGKSGGLIDLEQQLQKAFNPQTPIEEATLGAVTVKTKAGSGSGFFVTNTGYIITNKHVVRIDRNQDEEINTYMQEIEKEANTYAYQFSLEQDHLRRAKRELYRYRDSIRKSSSRAERRHRERVYQDALDRYKKYQRSLDSRRASFSRKRRAFNQQKREYNNQVRSVNTSQRFTILLKNQLELSARLVAVSPKHDLALLKINGYKTPSLRLAPASELSQGANVYAIGSPIGLSDSVASGILSGYTPKYIKTDAKIYPGNSGGPLVDEKGNVIGINTMKKITHKFEGLGFAIPIRTALDAFQSKLQTWTAAAD